MIKDFYKTVDAGVEVKLKINRSAFIGNAFHVEDKAMFAAGIENIRKKYFDANHHPFAYRIGLNDDTYKFSDDGEPSGSSGKPVLEAIDKFELTDIGIVVTRYFGGIKLGVGGLKRAYFQTAEECLKSCRIITKFITKNFLVVTDYEFIGAVMNFIEKSGIEVVSNISDEKAKVICSVRLSVVDTFNQKITELTNGKGSVDYV